MNILFFSHDGKLGDAVLHTYFVNQIYKNLNNKIYCITANGTKEFWSRDGRLNNIWNIDKPSFVDIIKLAFQIRKLKIDYIIMWNKPKSEKIKLLNWLINPSKGIHFFATNLNEHAINRGVNALNLLTIPNDTAAITYSIQINNWNYYEFDHQAIYLNLFSTAVSRSININDSMQIINGLQLINKRRIYITYTNLESKIIEKLKLLLVEQKIENIEFIYTQNNLSKLIWLCYSVALIITPDTSVTHIASAFNKPVITLFKKENAYLQKQWAPLSEKKDSIIFFDIYDEYEKKCAIQNVIKSSKKLL